MIKTLINNIFQKNLTESKNNFNSIISEKLESKLNEKRIEIAKTFFQEETVAELDEENSDEETEEDQLDEISASLAQKASAKAAKSAADIVYKKTSGTPDQVKKLDAQKDKFDAFYSKKSEKERQAKMAAYKSAPSTEDELNPKIQSQGSKYGGRY